MKAAIDAHLLHLLKGETGLFEMARYAIEGGKRLRPLIAVTVASLYDVPIENSLTPACALELVHTYSLIHDDLPCMDNDDLRRGRPTLHRAYPEGHAVLAGDFLLTYAFELLADDPLLSYSQRLRLISCLGKHAGAEGMVGGQLIDLDSTGEKISADQLLTMHAMKTAALISAAFCFGAIIADVNQKEEGKLKQIGHYLGLAFQLADDLSDGEELEKGKATALSILGKERAIALLDQLAEKAEAGILQLEQQPASELHHLASFMLKI